MELLFYNELQPSKNKEQFDRVCEMLRRGDFAQAEVKKLTPGKYYRAKLNDSDRLLFTFMSFRGERFILLLEILYNHAYDKSRFLNGALIDESRIPSLKSPDDVPSEDAPQMVYRNPARNQFHLLDRPLSFDDLQERIFSQKLPAIIVGSAGSGKTVLSIEKMKNLKGEVLYVTRSSYLADNARRIYSSFGYDNERQNITFASFDEVIRGIKAPDGRMADFNDFYRWFQGHAMRSRFVPHQLYEEFGGVITGSDVTVPFLSREQYLGLGIRQSIYLNEDRDAAYAVFTGWLSHCKSVGLYIENVICHEYLALAGGIFDWMVVDEVQDMTNVQLYLLLKLLERPYNFLLCGDSNQIVHPNFFSWSGVKSMFYKEKVADSNAEIQILHANYRNSRNVTELANQLLRLKVARFGSVDRESNFLVDCISSLPGDVSLLQDSKEIRNEFNSKTSGSVDYAVLVLNEEDKGVVSNQFQTPLVFSVREAKGLEYRNVIIYNLVSDSIRQFEEIAEGVSSAELVGDLKYARNKDKSDKGLEIYKFFINSLYVAITRAIENVYWIERNPTGRLFRLLKVSVGASKIELKASQSSLEDWRREAVKLERQGRREQADKIVSQVLKQEKVPWEVITRDNFGKLCQDALSISKFNKQAKQKLLTYADIYEMQALTTRLRFTGFNLAFSPRTEIHKTVSLPLDVPYNKANFKNLQKSVQRYGVDFRDQFNRTPLMMACRLGDAELANWLLENDADTSLEDNCGMTAYHHLLKLMFLDTINNELDNKFIFFQDIVPDAKFYPESIAYSSQEQQSIITRRIKAFFPIFSRLAPEVTTIRVDGREIRLGASSFDSFLLNYIKANIVHKLMMPLNLYNDSNSIYGFTAKELEAVCGILPDFIMSDYRKRRAYITAVLAKNECFGKDRYNKKYLLRMELGNYILSPLLQFECAGTWMNWDEMLNLRFAKYPDFCPTLVILLSKLNCIRRTRNVLPLDTYYTLYKNAVKLMTAWGTTDENYVTDCSRYFSALGKNIQNKQDLETLETIGEGPKSISKCAVELSKLLFSLQDGLPSLPLNEEQCDALCSKKMKQAYQNYMSRLEMIDFNNWFYSTDCLLLLQYFECIPPLFLGKRSKAVTFKGWDAEPADGLARMRHEIEEKKPQ